MTDQEKEYMIHCTDYSLHVLVKADADLTGLVRVKILELKGMDSVVEGSNFQWIEIKDNK